MVATIARQRHQPGRRRTAALIVGAGLLVGAVVGAASSAWASDGTEADDSDKPMTSMTGMMGSMDDHSDRGPMGHMHGDMVSGDPDMARMHAQIMSEHPDMGENAC